MTDSVVCDNVVHVYGTPGQEVTALRGVDLTVGDGETVALLGPSGSGKTTLLWLMAGLMKPTAGVVEVAGRRTSELNAAAGAGMRLRDVGILLQNPARNLLPYDTALGNVLFAQRPTRRRPPVKRRRARDLLDAVGLGGVAHQAAGRLSGGEQQRLALAVAVANGPRVLLADEPTSQLDRASASAVVDLLLAANADLGTTIVAVTHDLEVAAAFGRTVTIRDGRVGAEGHQGQEYVVVGRDGTITLPPDLLEVLPPGTLARAVPTANGVELQPTSLEPTGTEPTGTEPTSTEPTGTEPTSAEPGRREGP